MKKAMCLAAAISSTFNFARAEQFLATSLPNLVQHSSQDEQGLSARVNSDLLAMNVFVSLDVPSQYLIAPKVQFQQNASDVYTMSKNSAMEKSALTVHDSLQNLWGLGNFRLWKEAQESLSILDKKIDLLQAAISSPDAADQLQIASLSEMQKNLKNLQAKQEKWQSTLSQISDLAQNYRLELSDDFVTLHQNRLFSELQKWSISVAGLETLEPELLRLKVSEFENMDFATFGIPWHFSNYETNTSFQTYVQRFPEVKKIFLKANNLNLKIAAARSDVGGFLFSLPTVTWTSPQSGVLIIQLTRADVRVLEKTNSPVFFPWLAATSLNRIDLPTPVVADATLASVFCLNKINEKEWSVCHE
jgi:hypothetical protein